MSGLYLEFSMFLLVFFGFYLITYIIGFRFLSILNYKNNNCYFDIFLNSTIGYLIILFLYSILKTKGQSIHILLIIPLIFLTQIPKQEKEFQNYLPKSKIVFWYFFIPILLIFFFQTLYFYNPFTGISYSLDTDNFYYANVGSFLQQIGKENRFLDWTNSEIAKPEIYHYADTWMVALFAEFNLPSTKGITLVVNVYFYFQVYLGSLVILETFTKVNFYKSIFALSLFFISCFFINYDNFTFTGYGCVSLVYPKLAQILVFFILAFHSIINKKFEFLVFSLLTFIIIYIPVMPPIMIGLSLFLVYLWQFKKINFKRFLVLCFFLFLFSISFIILFKVIFSQLDSRLTLNDDEKLSLISIIVSKIKDIIYTTLFNIKDFSLQIIPYFLLLAWVFKTNTKFRPTLIAIFFFYLFLLAGGMVVFGLRYNFLDSVQFYQNLAYPLTSIIGFYLISIILFDQTKYRLPGLIFMSFILSINFYSSYKYLMKMHQFNMVYNITKDEEYAKNVMKLVSSEKNPRFAIAKGKDDYKTIYDKGIGIYLNPFIGNKINTYMPASITIFDIPLSEKIEYADMEKTWIDNSALNLFAQRHKEIKDTIDLQIHFLKENEIQFIEMAKHYEIPIKIKNIIDTIVINPRNGVRFAKIKL